MKRTIWSFLFTLPLSAATDPGPAHYVGKETCALCHQQIALTQQHTAMAGTWQGNTTSRLPPSFAAKATETPGSTYEVSRNGAALNVQ